jgi:polysaccharide export outer membrane protein
MESGQKSILSCISRRSLVLAVPLALAACATTDLPTLPPTGAYRLGPGDEIRVAVFGQKQLSARYRIAADGHIAIPLLKPIAATGLTPDALAQRIATRLTQAGLLAHPAVAVEIRRYRPFYILGEVRRPGAYPFQPGMTVLTAASIAGGFTDRAAEQRFLVIRSRNGEPHRFSARADSAIAPGDVIKVRERHF